MDRARRADGRADASAARDSSTHNAPVLLAVGEHNVHMPVERHEGPHQHSRVRNGDLHFPVDKLEHLAGLAHVAAVAERKPKTQVLIEFHQSSTFKLIIILAHVTTLDTPACAQTPK